MKRFRNILVGVDLLPGRGPVADSLPASSAQAIERAAWLAKQNGSRITFLYSMNVSERDQQSLWEDSRESSTFDEARHVLVEAVGEAGGKGIDAGYEIAVGKPWVQIIRQVLTHHHDLVVVGTRNLTAVSRILIGSTGMKLLRKCPSPVWVTKPSARGSLASVLVAHDLTPVGTLALQLGASMSALEGAALHVLHAIEHPEYDHMLPSRIPAGAAAERRAAARSQIGAELDDFELAAAPKIVLTDDEPSAAILQYLESERIELLVMGTIARTGISGVITGNTAERLLPNVPCSLLAVKPEEFVSPVELNTSNAPR